MVETDTFGERLAVTVVEAAKLLGIGRALAYQAAANGDLPTIRVGRRILVPLARLNHMLESDPPPRS
jgi:excisionase family DNA binding protein